jgi:hypothetical protein
LAFEAAAMRACTVGWAAAPAAAQALAIRTARAVGANFFIGFLHYLHMETSA